MKLLLLGFALFFILLFPFLRCILFNFPSVVRYGSVDLFTYFRYHMWNNIPEGDVVGKIRVYTGLFGKGKTLSAVMYVTSLYDRYNNKMVYDSRRKKMVQQRCVILSNVELSSEYYTVNLKSLNQITELAHQFYDSDQENDTYTALLILIDELSVQLNSREFKSNMDPVFINTLLTCRKYHLALIGTAQRFSSIDALFRSVTQDVVECNKIWRLQGQKLYDGYELENCTNPELVQPRQRWCYFVRDRHYGLYNTHAMVENLEKHQLMGDLISEDEILQHIAPQYIGADTVVKYSKKASKRKPNHKKYSS